MTIPFIDFFERMRKATGISSQTELARALGVNRSAITQAKVRGAVPQKWVLALARRYTLSADWLEFGRGAPRPVAPGFVTASPVSALAARGPKSFGAVPGSASEELLHVPKASARLCAGGGSFEVDAMPVGEYPMPLRWLSRLGSPSHMILMDVVGDSMEPGIIDGDTVLIDRANTRYADGGVLAVGLEDAIYLKRLERTNSGMLLRSDNPTYVTMKVRGDELDSFRIIGKVVWLCRNC